MIKSEIFRKGYYGFSLLISIGVLVLGIWVQSLIPDGCNSDKLRSGARALITLGTIMSVLNLSVFLCSKYCNIKEPENTSTFMLFLMLISYIVTIVYLIQTISGVKGAQFPAPLPNKCTTYSDEKDCDADKLCWWNKDTEICNYRLKSCIPNNKTILAVLGVLVALVVVMVVITIAFIYFKTKKDKSGPSKKEIADKERIEREKKEQEERDLKDEQERQEKEKEDARIAHDKRKKELAEKEEARRRKEEEDKKDTLEYKAEQLAQEKEYDQDLLYELKLEDQIKEKEAELKNLIDDAQDDDKEEIAGLKFNIKRTTDELKTLKAQRDQLYQKNIQPSKKRQRIFADRDNMEDSVVDFNSSFNPLINPIRQ